MSYFFVNTAAVFTVVTVCTAVLLYTWAIYTINAVTWAMWFFENRASSSSRYIYNVYNCPFFKFLGSNTSKEKSVII